ncbi:MAG: hypothetical protein AB7G37_17085 [Solirubrobacteraceae bacterium]
MVPSPTAPARSVPTRLAVTALCGAAAVTGLTLAPAPPATAAPSDLDRYYRYFDVGPKKIPGSDTYWTPQGLAYWAEQDALVISYYDSQGKRNSRLAVIDRRTGTRKKLLAMPTKGHVGGLAMSRKHLWVANNGRIVRFTKRALTRKKNLAPLKSAGSWKVAASSYLTIHGRSLWVGSFKKGANDTGTVYRHDLNAKERPSKTKQTLTTPSRVQGMAISGDRVIWSRSYGRDVRSRIDVAELSNPTQPIRILHAPNMSEGIVAVGSRLHVVYESGSKTYADASYRIRSVHHGSLSGVLGP